MNDNKSEYVRYLLIGRNGNKILSEAALIFYHSEVPVSDAMIYMNILETKVAKVAPKFTLKRKTS